MPASPIFLLPKCLSQIGEMSLSVFSAGTSTRIAYVSSLRTSSESLCEHSDRGTANDRNIEQVYAVSYALGSPPSTT